MEKEKILVTGAGGQVGTELVEGLSHIYGVENIVASDIREPKKEFQVAFELLDILDRKRLLEIIKKHNITQVYHLVAVLSATAESNIHFAWRLNINGLYNVLELAREKVIKKVFWPSSIAVFGPTTPKIETPQATVTEPNTVYGISKLAGERWCEYYHQNYDVDVRSIRYPGLVGYKSEPGGGTTDYAVHIFHEALKHKAYESFIDENTVLPMMYMPDAIRATIELMQAPPENIKQRGSYNIASISFSPKEIAAAIKKHVPDFQITYKPDHRQKLAETWPSSIDDSAAKNDWDWNPEYNLEKMVKDILYNLKNI